jgi:CDP-glucose 4,6-dehydratase
MINDEFWKKKRVFITGHEGFLGSNLTKRMIYYGARVVGLDTNVKRKNTLFTADDYCAIKTFKGSVADPTLVRKIIAEHKPEIVFHLAAEAIVGKCNNDPICAFKSNIEGTWNVLESCRSKGFIKAIIVASSDKAYGSHKILPYKEDAPLIGNHPYDVSKSCADLIAYTYFHTYGTPIAVTRCGNIYGPGDFNFSRIVPDAIRCAIENKTLKIRSDGKFTRDYVFVDDIVNGYIMLAEQLQRKLLSGEAFNFSDESPITVRELARKIFDTAGVKIDCVVLDHAKYEIKHQYLAASKARNVLGWKPLFTIEQGLMKTVEWYGEYFRSRKLG